MSNQGSEVQPTTTKASTINMIACGILISAFLGCVCYASIALMGNRNDNFEEKVKLMQEKNVADEATTTAPVSEVVIDRSEK